MTETLRAIPVLYVERFAAAYAAFLAAIRLAIDDVAHRRVPPPPNPADALGWHKRVLPLLESRYAAIEAAMARFKAGDPAPIARCALDASGLAKNLDGFSFAFAGPEHEQTMKTLLGRIVLAAYPVYSSAGLS